LRSAVLSRPDWRTDGAGWPHRAYSRFVTAGGVRWHVQVAGQGPALLLLHGSGGSTHSWARLLPRLTPYFTVVAPDLPGHAFSSAPAPERLSLPGVAGLVAALLAELGVRPALAAGHSAGAAVALRMTLDGTLSPAGLVGLNPALAAFEPPLGPLRPLVYALAGSEPYARLLSTLAVPAAVEATLASTGSRLDDGLVALYARLAASPGHVHGTMSMMSRWDVAPLIADYPRLRPPVALVFGGRDRWLDRAAVEAAVRPISRVRAVTIPDTGHLTHEEQPSAVAGVILDLARETGVIAMP
jgi:magnesium chelatase accessory protein